MAKTLTLALAAGGLQAVWVADPAWACGCGAAIANPGATMSVAQEQAVVRFDGTTEDVVMRFSVEGDATDAAWVVPVPGPSKVALADKTLFGDLVTAEAPVPKVHHYFWPHLDFGGSAPPGVGASAAPSGVQVLSDQHIGEFEVANLAASDPKALGDWLNQHSFTMKASTATRLASYTDQGWQVVAVRLATGTSANLHGALDPIRITFASKTAVYPMRLSAGATTPQTLSVAVLAPHRMDAASSPIADEPASSSFGDWIDPSKAGPALANLAAGRMFLTVFNGDYTDPSQITQDFAFAPAKSDWVQHDTYDEEDLLTFFGIPVFLIVVLLPLVAAVGYWLRQGWKRGARARAGAVPLA